MGMLKPWHIIVLVVVILLLFGARKLPDLARSVGQSLKIFKSEVKDLTSDDDKDAPIHGGQSGDAGAASGSPAGSAGNDRSTPPPGGVHESDGPKA
jgi:sec-independent protein translocase protein TatA